MRHRLSRKAASGAKDVVVKQSTEAPAASASGANDGTPGGARDPFPFANAEDFWSTMTQVAIITMAAILLCACLYLSRALVMPVLGALVVSLTLGPLAGTAVRHGLPAWIPALVIVILIAVLAYIAVAYVSDPIADLVARSPQISAEIKEKFRFMERPIAAIQELRSEIVGAGKVQVEVAEPGQVIGSLIGAVTPALVEFVLFFATLFFLVIGRNETRRFAVSFFTTREGRLRTLKIANDFEHKLSLYLITVTIINACVGIAATIVTWALGFPTPLLWGALAFALNYIPYVGAGLMQATLFLIGLMTFDTLLPALIAPAIFLTFSFIEGNFLVPAIIGRQLLLHPLAVFLSLAFWSWIWGVIGAFLATPILIMVTVAIDHLYPRNKSVLPD